MLEQTLGILNQSGQKVYKLPQWHDVDDLTGLIKLVKRSEKTTFQNSGTMSFILDELSWILDDIKLSEGFVNV